LKVPGVRNVFAYWAPLPSVPLASSPPEVEVTVWLTPSLFVHVTVSPTSTVTDAGE